MFRGANFGKLVVKAANESGGSDNVTVKLSSFSETPSSKIAIGIVPVRCPAAIVSVGGTAP